MKPLPQDEVSKDFALAVKLLLSGIACLTAASLIWNRTPPFGGIALGVGIAAIVMSGLGFWYVWDARR